MVVTLPVTASDRATAPGFCLCMNHVSFGSIGKQRYTILIHTEKLFTCTVKPVLVATSIKQATCIKRSVFQFPIMTNKY